MTKIVKAISFSPTGTTRKVLEGIVQGLDLGSAEYIDITSVPTRTARNLDDGFVIIGVPVYAGRVPVQAREALAVIKAAGAPAALVVVYGNRAYEDALYELKEIAEKAGFRPFAAAAFIGEHSFSTDAVPIAPGRPDKEDLEKARRFGRLLSDRMDSLSSSQPGVLVVPGNPPSEERRSLNVCPESVAELCVHCGICSEVCPQQAISLTADAVITDGDKCIHVCCSCVKACPTGARQIVDQKALQFVNKVAELCRGRKEPEFFVQG